MRVTRRAVKAFGDETQALAHQDVDALLKGWDAPPPYQPIVQKLGDAWIKSGGGLAWPRRLVAGLGAGGDV